MRSIRWCLLIVLLASGLAHAQTFNDVQVRLGAYTSSPDGGERPVGVTSILHAAVARSCRDPLELSPDGIKVVRPNEPAPTIPIPMRFIEAPGGPLRDPEGVP